MQTQSDTSATAVAYNSSALRDLADIEILLIGGGEVVGSGD